MKILENPSKEPGVYCFLSHFDGKRYIGQSVNMMGRLRTHLYQLKHDKHSNRHLQRAWNKYGAANFEYLILERCKTSELIKREQFWADKYESFNQTKGYNTGKCMRVWNTGIKYSKAARKKISAQRKRDLTPKMLKMLRTMNIGRKFGKEFREKCKHNFLGKHHTKKTKEMLSIAQGKYQASLSKDEKRKTFTHRMKTIRLTSSDGKSYEITGMRGFCEEFKLDRAAIARVLCGKNKHHLGWKAFIGDEKKTKFIIKKYG